MPTAPGSTSPPDGHTPPRRRLPWLPGGADAQYADRLDARDLATVRFRLDLVTIRRMHRYLPVLAALHLLMLLVIDLPSIQRARSGVTGTALGAGEPVWLPISYLLLRLAMLGCWAVGIAHVRRVLRGLPPGSEPAEHHRTLGAASRANEVALGLIGVAGLSALAGVAVLDQLRSGDVLTFTMAMLIIAGVLLMRPPLNVVILGVPFVVFLTGLLALQDDTALLTANLANSGVMLATSLVISAVLYNAQFRQQADALLLERANLRLDRLSLHDQLTGLPNRRRFTLAFEQEVERLRRGHGRAFLVIADLDRFKAINDRGGHPAGDAVLCLTSAVLRDGVRATDVVSRWGGEEFLLLLVDADADTAVAVTERLRSDLEAAVTDHDGHAFTVTASFGITEVEAGEPDPLTGAYARADAAMYAAKQAGGNRVHTTW